MVATRFWLLTDLTLNVVPPLVALASSRCWWNPHSDVTPGVKTVVNSVTSPNGWM